jgi:hypothetical protein
MKLTFNTKSFRLMLQALLGLSALLFVVLAFAGLSVLSGKSSEVVDLKLKNRTTEAQLSALKVAKAEVAAYAYFKDVANKVIPSDKNQDQAVVEIFKLADESGIKVEKISFPASELGNPSSSAPSSGSTTGTPAAGAKSAISQAKPVEGISGLYSLKVTVEPDNEVSYESVIAFLKKLENNRRTAQITRVVLDPGGSIESGDLAIHLTVELNIFLKP